MTRVCQSIACRFRNDNGAAVTSVTYETVDDIQKNCHAVSQYGCWHSELLQSLSVLIYNKSAVCAELLYSNLPMLFYSPSLILKRRLPKHSPYLTLSGLLLDDAVVKNHFQQFGWCIEGSLVLCKLFKI